MFISSASNPHIKAIRALRQRTERERTGLFFVEGIRLVTEVVQPHPPAPSPERRGGVIESLIVAPELLTSEHARALVEAQRRAGVTVLDVSRAAFETLSAKDGPQGLGAVVRQRWERLDGVTPQTGVEALADPRESAKASTPTRPLNLWIALDAAQDPGNIGTILRTSDAVGGAGLILLGHSADPHDPSAVRASMGAIFSQRLVRANWEQFVAWTRQHGVTIVGTSDKAMHNYQAVTYLSPLVLLMGSEREGLSAEQQAACDLMVQIPMVGRSDSLNLAVATSVVAYEVFNQRRRELGADPRVAEIVGVSKDA